MLLGPIRAVQGFASNQAQLYPAEDIVTGTCDVRIRRAWGWNLVLYRL